MIAAYGINLLVIPLKIVYCEVLRSTNYIFIMPLSAIYEFVAYKMPTVDCWCSTNSRCFDSFRTIRRHVTVLFSNVDVCDTLSVVLMSRDGKKRVSMSTPKKMCFVRRSGTNNRDVIFQS